MTLGAYSAPPEQAIKDPFVLEFLNLKDEYSESELEGALIQHLADFLLMLLAQELEKTQRELQARQYPATH
jgi:hypothetical protein